MLKFFRKYNKIILVVGGVVLMVAFLIPQAAQMFAPTGANRVLGQALGADVTAMDMQQAAQEVDALSALFGVTGSQMALGDLDREQWLLMKREAAAMGLSASNAEVAAAVEALGLNQPEVANLLAQRGLGENEVRYLLREYLAVARYRALITGRRLATENFPVGGSPGVAAILLTRGTQQQVLQMIEQQGGSLDNLPPAVLNQLQQQIVMATAMQLVGRGRVSPANVTALAGEMLTGVEARAVRLPARADADVTPDDALLNELFADYRDVMPGAGEPYPFGYRYPDRVKLEWLVIPAAPVRSSVRVDPVDIVDAYQREPGRWFTGEGTPPEMPDAPARQAIREALLNDRAEARMDEVVTAAQAVLVEDARGLPERLGYREVPATFAPLPLEEVARRVSEQTGVPVTAATANRGDWITLPQVQGLDIGNAIALNIARTVQALVQSRPEAPSASLSPGDVSPLWQPGADADLAGVAWQEVVNRNGSLPAVIAQARELWTQDTAPPLRVQAKLPGPVMVLPADGSRLIIRLAQAAPTQPPASLDEVREQVAADARRLLDYRRLTEQLPTLRAAAIERGLNALADDHNVNVRPLGPFPRRVYDPATGVLVPPSLPDLGALAGVVDDIFTAIADLPPDADAASLPADQRILGESLDDSLSVVVLEITSVERPTPRQVRTWMTQGEGGLIADLMRYRGMPNEPLTLDSLAARTGFENIDAVEEVATEPTENEPPADAAS